jgi:hypothetical protein
MKLNRACTLNDGILQLEKAQFDNLCELHTQAASIGRLMKFVPSSGAASRMFKILLEFCKHQDQQSEKNSKDNTDNAVGSYADKFLEHIGDFAFFSDLESLIDKENDLNELKGNASNCQKILDAILCPDGLNYVAKPKGIIPFHKYDQGTQTAFQEQLKAGMAYCQDADKTVRIHFTVSNGDEALISEHINHSIENLIDNDCQFEISYSVQNPASDTIALSEDNDLFRDNDGNIVLRPGGHGALLMNLASVDGEIVFLKNIDNVTPDYFPSQTTLYKKLLCGLLIDVQQQIFAFMEQLDNPDLPEDELDKMYKFAFSRLFRVAAKIWSNYSITEKRVFLNDALNRPIRVCGMVKNTGEPGGGPFWVEDDEHNLSLQIVEKAQIDLQNTEQAEILKASTHFNPVDLVCGLKDYKGEPFDLHKFTDPEGGIISRKSYQGRTLLALEHPGLWNGAMAKWNTIFVEVPLSTFNPVKTINDLLRPEHLPPDSTKPTAFQE